MKFKIDLKDEKTQKALFVVVFTIAFSIFISLWYVPGSLVTKANDEFMEIVKHEKINQITIYSCRTDYKDYKINIQEKQTIDEMIVALMRTDFGLQKIIGNVVSFCQTRFSQHYTIKINFSSNRTYVFLYEKGYKLSDYDKKYGDYGQIALLDNPNISEKDIYNRGFKKTICCAHLDELIPVLNRIDAMAYKDYEKYKFTFKELSNPIRPVKE